MTVDQQVMKISIEIDESVSASPRLSAALEELADALAVEEIAGYVEEPEVSGFGFAASRIGDLGGVIKPTSMDICFGKTKGGGTGGGGCGNHCTVNSDPGMGSCSIYVTSG